MPAGRPVRRLSVHRRDPRSEPAAAGELQPWAWTADLAAKVPVIAGYRTQVDALFPGGEIPLRPETYYAC